MKIPFWKYHGNGNDFVITDNRSGFFPVKNAALVKAICNRNFGVGADGMMLLEDAQGFDFHMRYFNSDGLEGSMCGNGGRCMVHFAKEIGLLKKTAIFSGIDGPHEATIDHNDTVHLKMQDVTEITKNDQAYIINTGSPHYILFAGDISELDVVEEGRKIRYNREYSEKGINVNFVEPAGDDLLIRTYERGVENETLACGTGSVAAALCTVIKSGNGRNRITIHTKGGPLEVSFRQTGKSSFSDIWLTGPARKVFSGTLETGALTVT